MSKWQNLDIRFYAPGYENIQYVEGKYDMPIIEPLYELPDFDNAIEFDYCMRNKTGRNRLAVHFFEDDYKFERCWNCPDKYGKLLQDFAFVIGPDFSTYWDMPKPLILWNQYRNRWLCKYWQEEYNIPIVPTIMYGDESTYDWCFDGFPKKSIVSVSNVGFGHTKEDKIDFMKGYEEMLKRLEPSKILFFTRNFQEMPGNVQYIHWELLKGEQQYG